MKTASKDTLRQEMRARRAAVPPAERAAWNRRIQEHLFKTDRWNEARSVMAYASLPDEVDTQPILEKALAAGKRLFLPRCVRGKPDFDSVEIRDPGSELEPGPMPHLLQPLASLPGETARHPWDLILVPGVVFDQAGGRIGFGAGMYDRFLKQHPEPFRLALAFSFQIVERVPVGPRDFPVHAILTEEGLVEAGGKAEIP